MDDTTQVIDDGDIPWLAIRNVTLTVVDYKPLAAQQPGSDLFGRRQIKDFSHSMPYAFAEVTCDPQWRPTMWRSETALLPVNHRLDFAGLDEAMSMVHDSQMVWITYRPIKFPWYWPMKRTMPVMIVWVLPRDQSPMRDDESREDWWRRKYPVWTYEPLISKFDGRWIYEDQDD